MAPRNVESQLIRWNATIHVTRSVAQEFESDAEMQDESSQLRQFSVATFDASSDAQAETELYHLHAFVSIASLQETFDLHYCSRTNLAVTSFTTANPKRHRQQCILQI